MTSTKRQLPSWLKPANHLKAPQKENEVETNSISSSDPAAVPEAVQKSRRLPSSFYHGLRDSSLPLLKFSGQIYYCYHKDDCNFICADLRTQCGGPFGFDIEWRVSFSQGGGSKKTSLLQLCPDHGVVYLFHLSCMSGFPSELKGLLEDDSILKAGVGIAGDMSKLAWDFNIKPQGIVDLSVLANEKTAAQENWSLTGLVMNLFKSQLNKDHAIRCSNWERYPLTEEQEQYAASDAYACYIIYRKLLSMGRKSKELETA